MCDKHHSHPDVSEISQKMVFHRMIKKDGMNQFISTKQKKLLHFFTYNLSTSMSNAFSETEMWTNSFYDDSPFQFVQLLWKIYVQFLSATLPHLILLFRKMSQYI